jgi:integrase
MSHVPEKPSKPKRVGFSDRSLKALKPSKERGQPVYDTVLPGLCVRVGARGTVFYVTKRDRTTKKFRWVRLGNYPVMGLAEARARARDVIGAVTESKPIPPPAAKGITTFEEIAERFIVECLPGKRTAKASEQTIRREFISVLGPRPITSIVHEDLVKLLQDIADRPARHRNGEGHLKSGGPHAARKARAELSPLLKWAAFHRIGGLQRNPLSEITNKEVLRGRQYSKVRDRVLTDAELRVVWRVAGETPHPFGPLIRALILTGQRLNEIAEARWSEIDEDVGCLVIPGERMKAKAAHAVPLTPRVCELFFGNPDKRIDGLPRFKDGDFVFTTTGGQRPVSGFSKWKAAFDNTVAAIGDVKHWRIHDLRRTMRTGLSRAKVAPFFAELVIAHTQKGVQATYDLHRYKDEVLAALQDWEQLLFDQILKEPSANVLSLRGAAA